MKRPFASKRPVGPFVEQSRDPEPTGIEVRGGPIWTSVEVTTFTGDRDTTPDVQQSHIEFVDSEVKQTMTSQPVQERVNFVGEFLASDVFTDSYTDITINSFLRFPEDMLSIRQLDEVTESLKGRIDDHVDLTMRSHRVVSHGFVEQRDPAITR